jgi:hypothetical protein
MIEEYRKMRKKEKRKEVVNEISKIKRELKLRPHLAIYCRNYIAARYFRKLGFIIEPKPTRDKNSSMPRFNISIPD